MENPKCDVCGSLVGYRKGGNRWSSIRGDENGVESVRTCSDACRENPKCAALIEDYNEREIAAEKPFGVVAKKRKVKEKLKPSKASCVFCCVNPCECGY